MGSAWCQAGVEVRRLVCIVLLIVCLWVTEAQQQAPVATESPSGRGNKATGGQPARRIVPKAFTASRYYPGRDGTALQGAPLLQNMDRVNERDKGYRQRGEALAQACALGAPVEDVEKLIEAGADPAFVDDAGARPGHKGRLTPLLKAIESGSTDLVQLLLRKGANATRQERNGDIPLIAAARRGIADIVKALVDAGARVDAIHAHR